MSHITNEELVLEAIRRTRGNKLDSGQYPAARCGSVQNKIRGWLGSKEMRRALENLLTDRKIEIECSRYKRENVQEQRPPVEAHRGLLMELPQIETQRQPTFRFYASTHGRLLPVKTNGKTIPKRLRWYYEFICTGLYIKQDGVVSHLSYLRPIWK